MLLTLMPVLFLKTLQRRNAIFSVLCVLSESVWLDVVASLLEGFLGIDAVSGA